MMYAYTPTPIAESDDELRKRLEYLVDDGYGQRLSHEIANASGDRLDEIAGRYNLRRRR